MQITVATVTPKKQGVSPKNNKPWTVSEIVSTDGQVYDTFDAFTVGETVEIDITPNPPYNAKISKARGSNNYKNLKNAEVSNKILEQNTTKEERITMLSCLSTAASFYRERQADEDKMIAFAEKLFKIAMKEKNDLPF